MISDTISPESSFGLRLAVALIISIGNICMLFAMCTNHWIQGKIEDQVNIIGLWKICFADLCMDHDIILYTKILLVIAIVFGACCNTVAILALVKGVKYLKLLIARVMLLTGVLALCGMAPGTSFLVQFPYFVHIEYGLIIGWVSVFLYYLAGFISWIHSRTEPDMARTLDEMRHLIGNSPPPSYTGQPPLSSIVS